MKKMNLKAASVMAAFLLLNAASAAFAANIESRPNYSLPVLTQASQAGTAWTNVIPNALASYFTYTPYSNASAVAMGFPATCGNKAIVTAQDAASTEDCYTISVREFNQQMALPGTFLGGQGLMKSDGVTPFGAATRAWGYGSGGPGWPQVGVTGNAPSIGPFTATGVWHAPAPTIKGAKGRPVRVQWVNELAMTVAPPTGLDPTQDCGTNAPFCYPYNRIVTHVHGVHVTPESDGFAEAWFTSGATFGATPTKTGAFFNGPVAAPWVKPAGPINTYLYPMDQEAGTIWYHDHAIGTTHTNTQMGMAGFFPITDDNEKYLQGQAIPTYNGGVAGLKLLPTNSYELGFALQDRVFTSDGQFAMPDYPIYDLTSGTLGGTPAIAFVAGTVPPVGIPCVLLANGLADPSTCRRLDWMYSLDNTHLIPYVAGAPEMATAKNVNAPFPAPNMTLEYFGNMPMVNGVTYGMYQVEPQIYRMRFIGGADSRTWNLQLQNRVGGAIVPMYQIATEQGFLNTPVARNSIVLMSGERVDVLVDFRGFALNTKFVMKNLGPDAPFNGNSALVDPSQAPSVVIPEIMEFDIVAANAVYGTVVADQATGIPALPAGTIPTYITNLRPLLGSVPTLDTTLDANGTPLRTRKTSLKEITDIYGRTMPTIDTRGFSLGMIPTTEVIRLNDTEEWDIINTTVDGHPMHVHQVQFKVISRTPFDLATFVPAISDTVNGIFKEPNYIAVGPSVAPDAWDAGWKDTVFSPPGMVTKIKARFDLTGLYVWHCHILSHEEHDMMRPLEVVLPMGAVTLAGLPAAGVVSATAGPVNFTAAATATAATGAVEYRFSYQLNGSGTWGVGQNYSTKATWAWDISAVPAGAYTVKVDARNVGELRDFASTLSSATYTIVSSGSVTAPANGAALVPAGQLFNWTASGATSYQIWAGTTVGARNIGMFPAVAANVTSATVTNLPATCGPVYIRLWSLVGGTWLFKDYNYTVSCPSTLTSPANGAAITPAGQTFNWTNNGATAHQIWAGTTFGSNNIGKFPAAAAAVYTANVNNLPQTCSPVYIRLWSQFGANWVFNDYNFSVSCPATMSNPPNNSLVKGASALFNWTNSGATAYQIWAGTTVGGSNIGTFPPVASAATSTLVSNLPANNSVIKLRLWSQFGTNWVFSDYSYTSTP